MFPGSLTFFDQDQPRWFISSSPDSTCSDFDLDYDSDPLGSSTSSLEPFTLQQPEACQTHGFLGSGITSMLGSFFQRILVLTDGQGSTNDQTTEEPTSPLPPAQGSTIDPDFACPICLQLLFQPISTSCGHTFCHDCIHIAFDRKHECPVCRTFLPSVPSLQGVNFLLRTLIIKTYPDLYEDRARAHYQPPRHTNHALYPRSIVGSLASSKDDIDNISIGDWADGSEDSGTDDAASDAGTDVSSLSSVDSVIQ